MNGHTAVFDSPEDLHAAARIRQEAGIARVRVPSGGDAWMILDHELVREALTSPRIGRGPLVESDSIPYKAKFPDYLKNTLQFKDGDEHARLRRSVAKWFAPRQIRTFQESIQAECARLLDAMEAAGSPADLVRDYAVPLPIFALTELLGADRSMASDFLRWNQTLFGTGDDIAEAMAEAQAECSDYLRSEIAAKRKNPGEDLLSVMTMAMDGSDALQEDEVVSLAMLFIIAGFDNTANFIGTGALALMRYPQQLDYLKGDIDGRIGTVVEELLRHGRQSVDRGVKNLGMPFAALADVEIGGVVIRAGEAVLINRNAANHDETVFEDPLDLIVSREQNPHLTFSYGVHSCLGAPLARLELQTSLSMLFHRFPDLRVVGEPEYQKDTMSEAIEALPVAWRAE